MCCGGAEDGTTTAHGADPARVGQDSMRDLKDETGKAYGEEFFAVAAEGEFNVVVFFHRRGPFAPSASTAGVLSPSSRA